MRHIVDRTIEVQGLTKERRAGLVAMLGVSDDLVEVVIACLEPNPVVLAAVTGLLSLADADPMEAGVLAGEMAGDRKAFRPVWALAVTVAGLPSTPPAGQAKAGLALARAAQKLDGKVLDELRATAELLG